MCGLIAAFTDPPLPEAAFLRAMQRMLRRGQDDEGMWQEPGAQLGQRRLAILDLDHRAAQPMHSADGRYVIVYNGEIYNFRELRKEREAAGFSFRTTSDTEVILALFAAHGEAMLAKLRGMFAFVIWDRLTRRAFAARDPYGIKPLYFATSANGILFASQVKALLVTGEVSREPDLQGQAGYWLLGSVPEPNTWYRDIRALRAGHYAWVEPDHRVTAHPFRDIGDVWRAAEHARPFDDDEVRERVRAALRSSVAHHLVSDVPVGVFLSGGIDSGALAGLMMDVGARDVQGVTLAYDEFAGSAQDEAPPAARIAAHYGIRHHVRRVTRDEFIADLPRILDAMDQPSIDGINTWYASKAAAELGLKVVVSGVGGDELFQGYASFSQLPNLVSRWRVASRIPGALAAARVVGSLQARRSGNGRWRHAANWARSLPGAWWLRRSLFGPDDLPALMGTERAAVALRGFEARAWTERMSGTLPRDARLALGQIESTSYLRNQLLRDSDWASMDHGVELRTPLVDAWLLAEMQPLLPAFRHFPNKGLLAGAPTSALPREIAERTKTGFAIPVGRWRSDSARHDDAASYSRRWARDLVISSEAST
jgi:asparagine synthase (glutamine-hydrolysing)